MHQQHSDDGEHGQSGHQGQPITAVMEDWHRPHKLYPIGWLRTSSEPSMEGEPIGLLGADSVDPSQGRLLYAPGLAPDSSRFVTGYSDPSPTGGNVNVKVAPRPVPGEDALRSPP
jgi:hypothetical protein